MADYYTQFSFAIPELTEAEKAWIKQLDDEQQRLDSEASASEDEYDSLGFAQFAGSDFDHASFEAVVEDDGDLWVHDGDGSGSTEDAANFVGEFLRRFRPDEAIGFEWANTCSRPRIDAFGGGAVFITASETRWMATSLWLYDQISKETE